MLKEIYSREHRIIVKRLKEARFESGVNQTEAAKQLGKTQSFISKIESGQIRIDILQLKEFAKIYQKPIDYFIK
ncbi:MAG: helix-turn-helix transcriptional regulator [Patescibacteria group bacterium]